uniref:Uncharacterized protein n=2 Tax=Cacopsylla melanoneura TaxID=428564 RepID=A0A8D8YSN3_9HEMI
MIDTSSHLLNKNSTLSTTNSPPTSPSPSTSPLRRPPSALSPPNETHRISHTLKSIPTQRLSVINSALTIPWLWYLPNRHRVTTSRTVRFKVLPQLDCRHLVEGRAVWSAGLRYESSSLVYLRLKTVQTWKTQLMVKEE